MKTLLISLSTLSMLLPQLLRGDGVDEELGAAQNDAHQGVVKQTISQGKEKVKHKLAHAEEFGAKNPGGFFITGGFLYWQAHEDGLEYATSSANISTATGKTYEPDFSWSPGFSLGVGYTLPVAIIDLELGWSRLFTHGRGAASNSPSTNLFQVLDYPGIGLSSVALSHASSKWQLHYNVVDMLFSREFKVNRYLYMKPSGGLRLAWIQQNYRVTYDYLTTPMNTTLVHFKNQFRGVGVRAGLDAYWQLHHMFSIFAKGGFSLFQGKFHLRETNELQADSLTPVTTYVNLKDELIRIVPEFDASLGARLEVGRYHTHYRFELLAAWEYLLYPRQNQLFLFTDSFALGKGMRERGDLSFQGLTLEALLHF
ncbi:MAG: Lpg1974 family pore-forming outer membrane protein [Chlamydiales bacterium]